MYSRVSSNSEANALELLENIEELFFETLWMNEWPFIPIHTDMCEHTGKELSYSPDIYLECIQY